MHPIANYKYRDILKDIHDRDPLLLPLPPSEFTLTRPVEDTYFYICKYLGIDVKFGEMVADQLVYLHHQKPALDIMKVIADKIDPSFLRFPSLINNMGYAYSRDKPGTKEPTNYSSMKYFIEGLNRLSDTDREDLASLGQAANTSIDLYIKLYAVLRVLEMDLNLLSYWDFSQEYSKNLKNIGIGHKTIVRNFLRKLHSQSNLVGFMKEAMSLKYLNGLGDRVLYDVVYHVFGRECLFRHAEYDDNSSIKSEKCFERSAILSVCRGLKMPEEYEDIVSSGTDTEWYSYLWLWLCKYESWVNRGSRMVVDGKYVYVHHHNVIELYVEQLKHKGVKGRRVNGIPIPHDLDVHPAQFFKKYTQRTAEKLYEDLKAKYAGMTFPEPPDNFKNLDPSTWRHISNPIELSQEGAMMSHCVGGHGFVVSAIEGNLYYHYDDGSAYGITVQLLKGSATIRPYLGIHWSKSDPSTPKGYAFGQVYGKHNTPVSLETSQKIADDLRSLNVYETATQAMHAEKINTDFSIHNPHLEPKADLSQIRGRGADNGVMFVDDGWGDQIGGAIGGYRAPIQVPDVGGIGFRAQEVGRNRHSYPPVAQSNSWESGYSLLAPAGSTASKMLYGLVPPVTARLEILLYISSAYTSFQTTGYGFKPSQPPAMHRLLMRRYISRMLFGFMSEEELLREFTRFMEKGFRVLFNHPKYTEHLKEPLRRQPTRANVAMMGYIPKKAVFELDLKPDNSRWLMDPERYQTQDAEIKVTWNSPAMMKIFGHVGVGDYILNVDRKRKFICGSDENSIVTYSWIV